MIVCYLLTVDTFPFSFRFRACPLSLLIIPSLFAVKDFRRPGRRRAKMADFDGERGRENGYFESGAVSPGDTHSRCEAVPATPTANTHSADYPQTQSDPLRAT